MGKKSLDLRTIFRRQMKWHNMNQTDLADLLGTSRQNICAYFQGRTNLSYANTEKLLDYFGLIQEPPAPKERPTHL